METLFLYFFVALAALFSLGILFARHPMRVAMSLICVMVSLAAIYAILSVHVVAIFQILIYVGAIMTLMIYIIMLLDDRDSSFIWTYSNWVGPASICFAAFLSASIYFISGGSHQGTFLANPTPTTLFTFREFSLIFLDKYLLHFELASLLLMVGVIAAVTVIKGEKRGTT